MNNNLLEQFKEYLFNQKNSASKITAKNYLSDINHFIRWFESYSGKSFDPKSVTHRTIELYKQSKSALDIQKTDKTTGSPLSPRSVERHLSSLRKFFKFLKLEGQTSHDPFDALTVSAEALAKADPYRLKDFKNFLYVYNASHLTIKNYIIDIKQFFAWAEQVLGLNDNYDLSANNLFAHISGNLLEEYKQRLLAPRSPERSRMGEVGFSPNTVNRKLSSLRKYLGWAETEGLIRQQAEISNLASLASPSLTWRSYGQNLELDRNTGKNVRLELEGFTSQESKATSEVLVSNRQSSIVNRQSYSHFPPIRLLQKISEIGVFAFDQLLTLPFTKAFDKVSYLTWLAKGRPVFTEARKSKLEARISTSIFQLLNPASSFQGRASKVKNISKEMYAPLDISTKYFPWYKKTWFTLRYKRPRWYATYHSYAITHYFHFAVLIIFMAVIGFGFYQSFFQKPATGQPALAALPNAPLHILSFQGRLTDNLDNPISTSSAMRFAIYNAQTPASGSALLWQEVNSVSPDQDGIFSILLGNVSPIPQWLFASNSALFLGVSVNTTPEMTPRQQLATVAFAANSELLQGLPPIVQANAGTTNVILALDSSGNLTIGGTANPTFQASGGQFTISGQPLLLTTNAGSNGNIQLAPEGLGKIDLTKPLQNTSISNNIASAVGSVEIDDLLSVLATSSGQSAFTLNQDSTGPLISASASGVAKFTVGNSGSLTSANYTNAGGILYSSTTGLIGQTAIGISSDCLIGGTTPSFSSCAGASAGSIYWNQASGALFPKNSTVDLLVGGQSTQSAKFAVLNVNSGTPVATIAGNLVLGSVAGTTRTIGATAMNALQLGDANTGAVQINPNGSTGLYVNGSGNVGIGTATPDRLLNLYFNNANTSTGLLAIEQAGSGDSFMNFWLTGGVSYALGIDNSDGDKFKIGYGTTSKGSVDTNTRFTIDTSGNVGIGTTSPLVTLDVRGNSGTLAVASISGKTSFAALVANNDGVGDLFTASASGTNKFAVKNNGTLIAPTYATCTLKTDANGLFTCGTDNTGSGSYSPFQELAGGIIVPNNSTVDFLIGGQATTSATFGILNNSLARGNQVATLSGNLTLDSTTASIQTTKNQLLTIGGNTTGNISISPLNGAAGSLLTVNAITTTLSGTTTLTASSLATFTTAASLGITATTLTLGNGSAATIQTTTNGLTLDSGSNTLTIAATDTTLTASGLTTLTLGTNPTINAGATALNLQADGAIDVNIAGGSGTTGCTIANSTGNLTCSGNISGAATGIAGYWQRNLGALAPLNITDDLLIGGIATSTAQFSVSNIAKNQAVASLSGQLIVMANNGWGGQVGIGTTLPLAKLDIKGANSLATLGTEKITAIANQDFSSDTGSWTTTGSPPWKINVASSGKAAKDAPGTGAITLANAALDSTPVAGNTYQITFDFTTTATSSGSLTPSFGGTNGNTIGQDTSMNQTAQTQIIVAASTNALTFTPTSGWYGTIDNVSVKEITPSSIALRLESSDGSSSPIEFRTGGSNLNNIFIGQDSGKSNTIGGSNTFLGSRAGSSNTTGNLNSFLGHNAGRFNTTGNQNSFIGYETGLSNTTGNQNSFLGYQAGVSNTTGNYNSFLGSYAGLFNTTGSRNSFLGYQAGYNNTTGNWNSFLGYQAGYTNILGSVNTFIGYQADVNVGHLYNITAIGANAYVTQNDSLILGSINGINSATASARIGIGTTAPLVTFDVRGGSGTLAVASVSGKTSFAALVANNDGVGDLFTASKSGLPIFTVKNNGQLVVGAPYYQTGACTLKTDTAGLVTCGTDNTGGSGSSPFAEITGGIIVPNNSTVDFLVGGQATTAAKFALINVAGARGLQTASLSGSLVLDSSTASVQTTKNQALTIGGNTTGNIIFTPNNTQTLIVSPNRLSLTGATTVDSTGELSLNTVNYQKVIIGAYLTVNGLTTPLAPLDVKGSASISGSIYFNGAGAVTVLNDGELQFRTSPGGDVGATTRMILKPGGNVGIGTTGPDSGLHVIGGVCVESSDSACVASTGTIRAQQFIDRDNTSYFLDPAATSTSLIVLGGIAVGTTSPLAETGLHINKNTLGNTAVVINQLGSGNLITGSASGTTNFLVKNNGDTVIGPGGVGKLTVTTLDPLYTIDGTRYSTYAPSMVGIKEEVTGKAALTYNPTRQSYSYKIDLNAQEVGSDLWLFSRVIDTDVGLTSVLLTPDSSAKVWYEKDAAGRSITFFADRKTSLSYRLTAPRFDHERWANLSDETDPGITGLIAPPAPGNTSTIAALFNQAGSDEPGSTGSGEFKIAETLDSTGKTSYSLVDRFGNAIKIAQSFSDVLIANIQAGYVHAQALTVAGFISAKQISTDSLAVVTDNVTIGGQNIRDYIASVVQGILNNSAIQQFNNQGIISPIASIDVIHTNLISPIGSDSKIALKLEDDKLSILNGTSASNAAVAAFDNQGNATFSGTIRANQLSIRENLDASEASISGTLRARKIIASEIEGFNPYSSSTASANYITNVTNIYNSTPSATSNPFPTLVATSIQPSASSSGTSGYGLVASGYISVAPFASELAYVENLSASYATFNQGLMVFGPTSLSDTSVVGQLSIDGNLILASNSINVLGGDLQLQPLKQGGLSVMAGLFYIDTNGNIKVGGNAEFAKDVKIAGTLSANVISPIPGNDLALNLGSNESNEPGSSASNSQFRVNNSSNSAILTINQLGDIVASGSGTFGKLNLSLIQPAFALSNTEIVATGSAGTASIRARQTELTINNPLVTEKSLIYVTPKSNQVIYLMRQVPGVSFTVGVSTPTYIDIPFNWIIVN